MADYGDPISYLVLEQGTPVYGSDGEQIGTVEHVLADEEEDIFDGIVVDTQAGLGGWRFADAPDIAEIHERGVVLNVSSTDASGLPEPTENPAAMEHGGAEDSESTLQAKLHRAWDFISGNY